MIYSKRYVLNTVFLIVAFCYVCAGQAISKDCQDAFSETSSISKKISELQSDSNPENKQKALKFFEEHNIENFIVHKSLLKLLRTEILEEIRQIAVSTLVKRKQELNKMFRRDLNPLRDMYISTMITQIEKGLTRALRNDPSSKVRVFILAQENYIFDYKTQRYLVQLLSGNDLSVRQAAEERLRAILTYHLKTIDQESLDRQTADTFIRIAMIDVLSDEKLQYHPLLHRYLFDLLQNNANTRIRMVALELLNIIYSIESLRLEQLDRLQAEISLSGFTDGMNYSKWSKSKYRKARSRVQSVVGYIQSTLMNMIKSEIESGSEMNALVVIHCIQFLEKIYILNNDVSALLKKLITDDSINIAIRDSAQQVLDNLSSNRYSK